MKLNKKQRAELFAMFGGLCAYCGNPLPERGWHADHIEPVMREWWRKLKYYQQRDGIQKIGMERPENDCISNMFPACSPCNLDKHCMPLEAWRGIIADKVGVLRRNYSAFRIAEKFRMVTVNEASPIIFHFERVAASEVSTELLLSESDLPANADGLAV